MVGIESTGGYMQRRTKTKYGTVLKVREIQERQALRELRDLQATNAQEQETLEAFRETQQSAVTDAVRSMKMKATDAQTSRAFIMKLSKQIREQEKKVKEVQSQEDQKRDELIERSRSREVVEKLDEKLRTEQSKELDRKEQRLIDVLAQRIRVQQQ